MCASILCISGLAEPRVCGGHHEVLEPVTRHACRQVLPLKSAVGGFLLDTLEARSLPALFKLAEEYDMRRLRSALVAHTALNLGALVKSLPVTSLAVNVWQDILRADTVSVRGNTCLRSGTQLERFPLACRRSGRAAIWLCACQSAPA